MNYQAHEVSKSVKGAKTIDLKNAYKAICKLKRLKVTLHFQSWQFGKIISCVL